MKLWPFGRAVETRDDSFTSTLINAIVSRAQGRTLAIPTATGALEAAAGVVGRAFASGEVSARPAVADALTPGCMELIGRSLIRRGEVVFMIDTTSGSLELLPAETWDVTGGPYPSTWTYRLTLAGPSRTQSYSVVPAASVLHFQYSIDAATPWRGNGPIQVATLAGRLSSAVVNALADEAGGPVGRLLGIPSDGEDATVREFKKDLRDAKGRVAVLESGDWDNVGGGKVELKTERFGADPPAGLVNTASLATREVLSACGLSTALFGGADSASTREAWRLALFGVIAPLGRKVQTELAAKLDGGLTIGWQELRASDLSGRARAFQSMVGGGMALDQAISVSGLAVADD